MYNRFKIEDMNELLNTKEQDIFDFIENQFTNDSAIKFKLCSVYKSYKILNVNGELIKNKIDFYTVKQYIQKDENKESNEKTIEEGVFIFEHFNDKLTELGKIVQDNTDSLNDWIKMFNCIVS